MIKAIGYYSAMRSYKGLKFGCIAEVEQCINPNCITAYYGLANLYSKMGNNSKAEEYYKQAKKIEEETKRGEKYGRKLRKKKFRNWTWRNG